MKKIFFLILLLAAFGHKPVQAQTANPSHVGVCLTDSCTSGGTASPTFVTSTYVAQTGAGPFASITSPSLTLSAGQMAVVNCRNATSTANAFTFSSSPSNTWSSIAVQTQASAGNNQMGYAFNVGAGSTTFTCTPATSAGYMSMIVLVYSASPIFSVLNTSTGNPQGAGFTTVTSPSFTTTQAGVIVMCATISSANDTWSAGTIAGQTATIRQVANTGGVGAEADAACEDIISGSSQASVTASINWQSSQAISFSGGAFN